MRNLSIYYQSQKRIFKLIRVGQSFLFKGYFFCVSANEPKNIFGLEKLNRKISTAKKRRTLLILWQVGVAWLDGSLFCDKLQDRRANPRTICRKVLSQLPAYERGKNKEKLKEMGKSYSKKSQLKKRSQNERTGKSQHFVYVILYNGNKD